MARGSTLTKLIDMVRKEIGTSTDPSKGVNARDVLIHNINKTQEWLHEEYNWPFLIVYPTKLTAAGSRYYDLPTNIESERVIKVEIKYNDKWYNVTRGITSGDYNNYDPEEDVRSDPALKWELYGSSQFEIWPLPATNDLVIKFTAIEKLDLLVYGSDTTPLDDNLIMLFTAAKLLRKKKSKDADFVLAEANKKLNLLKTRIHGKSTVTFATTQQEQRRRFDNVKWTE